MASVSNMRAGRLSVPINRENIGARPTTEGRPRVEIDQDDRERRALPPQANPPFVPLGVRKAEERKQIEALKKRCNGDT